MRTPDELTLVCPNSEKLLGSLRGHSLVVSVSSAEEIRNAYSRASAESQVRCIAVTEDRPLSEIRLADEWGAIPLSLHVPEMGDFAAVLKELRRLKELNIRIFMPAGRAANLTSARILSSLMVPTGLTFAPPVDWVALDDLMHYAMYTRTAHADIDPFSYVKSTYDPKEFTWLLTPFFENPLKYAHLDEDGNIALSAAGLREGAWIGRGAESLSTLRESAEYRHAVNSWQGIFLEDRKCAYCPAWRLCQGLVLAACETDDGVFRFMDNFITAADAALSARQAGAKWQP
jgi:hypothetical protein